MATVNDLTFQPRVTVVVPTFNRRQWIGECLDSILEQTYPHIEVIVIDDGSTDGTAEWIQTNSQYDAVLVRVQENSGASIARNNAVEMAKGDLIVFIDSDDLLLPDHVEKAVEVFRDFPQVGLFCCDSLMIDADGNEILNGKTWHQNLSEIKKLVIKTGIRTPENVFMFSNCFPGFTLRREVFQKVGGFIKAMFPADDYDLALRVAASEYQVFYLHEPLCLRREHDGQCSGIKRSVETCNKLSEAVGNFIKVNPDKLPDEKRVNERIAELKFELAIGKIKEGNRLGGMKNLIQAVVSNPRQVRKVLQIGSRYLK